jgi:hypothetical protein
MVNGVEDNILRSGNAKKWTWLIHPRQWHWDWICWEVVFPILLPTIVTFGIGLILLSAPTRLQVATRIIFDFSPVTICFFSVTLLATGLKRMWTRKQYNTGLFTMSLGLAIMSGFFAGIFTFFRQVEPNEGPNFYTYLISLFVFFFTVRICHASVND